MTSRLDVLNDVKENHPTTVRAIGERVGLSAPAVYHHLDQLRTDGLVTWEKGKARTIRPTNE